MPSIIVYILKVIICSGLFFSYYRLAFYNKTFHQWNRFYLLGSVILSLTLPLIKINLPVSSPNNNGQVIRLLNIVASSNTFPHEDIYTTGNNIGSLQTGYFLYMLISLAVLFMLVHSLFRIYLLIHKSGVLKTHGIKLVGTQEKDAPFSFFNYIFWNNKIDIKTETGKKIFHHELVHARELHSADILFMNMVIVFFWCNPFYWLIRREISLVHEFIADRKTVEGNDISGFSEMILSVAYPSHEFGITSNFFSSSIKRRIIMLTKKSKVNFYSRILILPLLCLIFAGFTLSNRQIASKENIILDKPMTVVIDAGHGGEDAGAVAPDGTQEKNITLSIAQRIKALNNNKNLLIKLTRSDDVTQSVREKVDKTVKELPDAFISLHMNSADDTSSGFEMYITNKKSGYTSQSQLLGTFLSQELREIYPVANELQERTEKGIWVLDAPAIKYPALLLECGNLNNNKDLSFFLDASNQDRIAASILRAIALFANDLNKK